MAVAGAYSTDVDSKQLAERVALDYVGKKIGANLGPATQPQQSSIYVPGPGSISTHVILKASGSVYRTASPTPRPELPRKPRFFGKLVQRKQPASPTPIKAVVVAASKSKLPTAIYKEALASQSKTVYGYEGPRMRTVVHGWSPPANPNTELRTLWRTIEKCFEPRAQELTAEDANEDRWIDEGLSHPQLKNVRTVRVRLHSAGPLPPRIAYDPDQD
jgi:hypothetical protein